MKLIEKIDAMIKLSKKKGKKEKETIDKAVREILKKKGVKAKKAPTTRELREKFSKLDAYEAVAKGVKQKKGPPADIKKLLQKKNDKIKLSPKEEKKIIAYYKGLGPYGTYNEGETIQEAAPKFQGEITATIRWTGKTDRFDAKGKTIEEVRKMLDPIVKKGGVLSYKVK